MTLLYYIERITSIPNFFYPVGRGGRGRQFYPKSQVGQRVRDRYGASWVERNLQLTMKVLFNEKDQEKEESSSSVEIKQEITNTEQETSEDRNNEKQERLEGCGFRI